MVVDDNSSSNPRSRPTVTGAGVDTNTPNSATKTTTTTKTPSSSPSSVAASSKKQKEINEEINKTEKLANSSNGRNRTGAEKSTQDQGDTTNDKETKQSKTTTVDVGTLTEPECLAPCDAGTEVHLSGIIWHESESGMLVVNVTWRNRSYVGTLLDASRHDWAPPRLAEGEQDSRRKPTDTRNKRNKRDKDKRRPGRGPQDEKLAAQARGPGKRISPNDQENNSDDNGKPVVKKPRTGGTPRVPTPDSTTGSGGGTNGSTGNNGDKNGVSRDSPLPIEGWYHCDEADCERKFRQYDALTYHKPKCKQAKDDARVKADLLKQEKKVEKGDHAKKTEIKSESTSSNSQNNSQVNNDTESEVARTLLEMKNEPNHEGSSQVSPIPSTGPPQLAKRPDNPGKAGLGHPQSIHHLPPSQKTPASMPRLVPKPTVQSDSMPPLPKLQPKPGLPVLQPKPNAGSSAPNTPQGTPIKSGASSQQTRQPGSPQLTQEAEGKLVMADQTPSTGPTSSQSSPQVGVKRPHSPFKPVQPAGMETNQTQSSPSHTTQNNARASPAYSDISDDGDPTQAVPEKEIDKDSGLTSSLAYKTGSQFSNQFHQRFEGSFGTHKNRDEKKDVKDEDKDAKMIKNENGQQSRPGGVVQPNQQKALHNQEPKKPTATIPPMSSTERSKSKEQLPLGKPKKESPQSHQVAVSQAGLPPHAHAMMAMPGYHNFAYPSGMPTMFPGLSVPYIGAIHPMTPQVMPPKPQDAYAKRPMDGKQPGESRQTMSPSPARSGYPTGQFPTSYHGYSPHHGAPFGLHQPKK